jgi:AcrR family transcriptional regulator
VPKNRQSVPREERRSELVSAATEMFLANGYAGTTMTGISASAGLSSATVYWYFKSKDDVFAAVMDRMLGRETRALDDELAWADPVTALTRGLADMRPFRSLHRSMHERMEHSQAVAEAHDRFVGWVRDMVYAVLDRSETTLDRELAADVAVAIFEGANLPEAPTRPAHEMMRFALDAMVRPQAGPSIQT